MNTSNLILKARKDIIKFGYESGGSSHYGGALSMLDFLCVLYNEFLSQPKDLSTTNKRDYFILSKGHSALGLYSVLYNKNYFDEDYFKTYLQNETDLIAHPIQNLKKGIESSNGSLGQGISMAVGIAHALKKKGLEHKVYCVVGDGECNEGVVYEAINYASHYKLKNLCIFLDLNGFQNDGSSKDILDIGSKYIKIFQSIGWEIDFINGNNEVEIRKSLTKFNSQTNQKPFAIIGKTIKGNGVDMMENNNEWHHNKISKLFYEQIKSN